MLEKSELGQTANKATWGDDAGKEWTRPNCEQGNLGDDVGKEWTRPNCEQGNLGGWRWKRVNLAKLREGNLRGWSWKRAKLSRTVKKATWRDDVGKEGCSASHVWHIAFPPWVVWKLGLITCVKYEVGKNGMPLNLYDEWHLALHASGVVCAWLSATNATWLILPVVICLSQRLSHACVSMN